MNIYFLIEFTNRNYCQCVNSYGSYGSSKDCNLKCLGNSDDDCGGILSNSVYDVMPRK